MGAGWVMSLEGGLEELPECLRAAANWVCLGPTRGRGRNDRTCARAVPVKTVWVYPLRTDFRAVLSQEASP